jgi:sortase A
VVETVQGEFQYLVTDTEGDGNGYLVVSPSQVEVLDDFGDDRLTLTACHPKYSARQRIIVVAELAPGEVPLPRPVREGPAPAPRLDDIDGEGAPALPTIALGVLCGMIWFLAWLVGRQWRKWPAYALGFPFFMSRHGTRNQAAHHRCRKPHGYRAPAR